MTKIKKSIWSAVVGVVMSIALVFGVFAGVRTNKTANAAYDKDQYVAEFQFIISTFLKDYDEPDGYTTEMLDDDVEYTVTMEDGSFTRTSTRMAAYERALELYNELSENDPSSLTADKFIRLAVSVFNDIRDMIAELDPIIADIVGTEDGQLGEMLNREGQKYYTCPEYTYGTGEYVNPRATVEAHMTSVVYSDKPAYDLINDAFEALDEHQQEYVRRQTNRGVNLFEVGCTITEILRLQTEVKTESFALEQLVDETDVLYSYKAAYDAVTNKYKGLDPSAQAESHVSAAYNAIVGLGEVFEDIEEKADAAKTSINNMEYYLEGDMVTDPEGEVVVDTQESYDAVAEALNAIYDGRRVGIYKVASFETFEEVPAEEKTALATYLTELQNYYDAGETLAEYQAEAAEVEADIEPMEVTAENHYKVAEVENEINEVYARYDALNTPDYNGHNNKQKYIAEDNRAKIEEYKETLDELNAWIKEVAKLVDSRNNETLTVNSSVADVDAVIAWALENDFAFNVNDKDDVEALIEDYEALVRVDEENNDEIKVNALADAREVLRLLEEKIDEAIALEEAKVEELKNLLDTIGELLAEGVKYADRVTYEYFTEVYNSLSEASQEALQEEENWLNYETLGEALNEIARRVSEMTHVSELKAAIANIEYRYEEDQDYFMSTESQMGEVGEVVVASEESINAATEKVEAVYNGSEHTTQAQVAYKIADLEYNWAEDVVETENGDVNAFIYYGLLTQEEYDKYDAAVAALAALKAEAAAVETRIEELEITHYRNQREEITTLYNDYVALDRGEYNDLRVWVNNGEKIEKAHEVLVDLDRWVYSVACAVDGETVANQLEEDAKPYEAADYVVTEATEGRIPVELTLADIDELLEDYEQLTVVDDEDETAVRQLSVKEAHDLLDARQDAIEEARQELQEELDNLATLLEEGVKYADREVYEELVQKLEELDPDAVVDTKNLDALEEALDEIAERAQNLGEVIEAILYRYYDDEEERYVLGTYEEAGEDGEVVVRSRESVEAAQAAVEAVYNGSEHTTEAQVTYKIASLTYPWAEDVIVTADGDVNAFVYYFGESVDFEGYYARYEAAVEAIEERKELAAAFVEACDALKLSVENNYKVKEEEIEALYTQYEALNLGELDNVQEWVDEPRREKVEDAKETLDALNAWLEAVANAINEEATETDGADAVIAAAIASVAEGNELDLTLPVVNALLDYHTRVTFVDDEDETAIRRASVQDAYDLLVARKEALEEAIRDLQDELDELEQLLEDGVKYSDREKYEELLERVAELQELGAQLDTSNLETVGEALETIEERTNALKTAIDNIEYYLDGEMVKDPTGEVVYDTKESLEEATAKVEAVYDGTEHVAALEFPWGETEEAALARWSEDTGIEAEDLAKYKAALAEFNRLWDIEKAVAERIDALEITEENHFKMQEETIKELMADLVRLSHEAQYINEYLDENSEETYFDHNNWIKELTDEQKSKTVFAVMWLETVNAFDNSVAQLCDETVTEETPVADVDALLAAKLEEGFDDQVTFDVQAITNVKSTYDSYVWMLEEANEEFEGYEAAFVAAAKPAKDVLDMMYNAARAINNDLAEKVIDILARRDELTESDYDKIMYVKDVFELFNDVQKAILENTELLIDEEEEIYLNNEYYYEDGWQNIAPYTIAEFLELANKFEFALYFKQAVDELVNQLNTTYFTVEGYVLEKALLSMYCNFDPSMQAMVTSSYYNLLNIDRAYKEMSRDEYTSYTTVTEDLEGQIDEAKTELEEAQATLEADIKEALGEEEAETVKEALENYKAAVAQAQADLEAAKDALVESITTSLDPEAESVEEAFETYKAAVAQAQADLEAAQEELVTEIKTALGDEEAESVQAALENYKAAVEETQAEQAQTQAEAAKAAENGNKENDEKVAKLKKALIITAVVGGVVAVAAVACIVVLFAKMAALGGAGAAGSSAAGSAAAEGGKDEE